ncbi:NnrU family protein [Pseudosulfitobacter koreensis]|uniref:NnrU family protein n=1 Tax=Pseudosulfitobacter koreensis TaxID=2968472 RepID=A0ABT1Z518_9RHOB|nr:NnrU family protein [Pseudosulfitobacter koreense]MCR8828203.1 NnrU family protein [Pseudosulfitobacter koreense]
MSWFGFAGIFAAFFATHSIPLRPAFKSPLVAWLGRRWFGVIYSLLSLIMLALLIHAAGRAPYVQLWPVAEWQYRVVQGGMLVVCLLLAMAVGRPNPFSFGGWENARFEPSRPGIVRLSRHPLLLALALWAGLHLLPNGNLSHVILFGCLATFALAGQSLIDRRKRRELGDVVWQDMHNEVARASLLGAPLSRTSTALRIAAGVALYAFLVALHPVVIGVPAG